MMQSYFFKFLLIIGFILVFMSCDDIGESILTESGIEGKVVRGPMCPVVREGESCPDQPFSALFHVFDEQETQVAEFQSNEEGYFLIRLSPGQYTIIPDESAPIIQPISQRKNVVVDGNRFTQVTLIFDTGIR
ncbi:MAG: hypothetical protein ACE5HX_02105 [bacterium]